MSFPSPDRTEPTDRARHLVEMAIFWATVGIDDTSVPDMLEAADGDADLLREARGRIVIGLHRNPTIDVVGIRAARLLEAAVMAIEPHRAA